MDDHVRFSAKKYAGNYKVVQHLVFYFSAGPKKFKNYLGHIWHRLIYGGGSAGSRGRGVSNVKLRSERPWPRAMARSEEPRGGSPFFRSGGS